MNIHDSERMAGLLEQAGYEATDDDRDADVIVINTCSVRERAEEKLFTRLGEIREMSRAEGLRPVVAVTGCVAQQEGPQILKRSSAVDVIVGTQNLKRLPMLVDEAMARAAAPRGRTAIAIDPVDDVSFPLGIARRSDPLKAYVTIIEGCNEFCAFCVVPYTRGHERMRPVADILADARHAVATGAKEIQLLGQIVNHYQAPDDPSCDFAALLERLNGIEGLSRIRFASPHPRHVTPRMIAAMRDLPAVCRHLHLPVQSGSTRVLAAMRRRHTREQYLELVARPPGRHAGHRALDRYDRRFPGETDEDFERDAVADGRGAVSQHVLVQVFRAAQHAGAEADAGRRAGGGEDAPDRGAAVAAEGHPGSDLRGGCRAHARRARRFAQPAPRVGALGAHERQHRRELLGPGGLDRTDGSGPDHRDQPEQPARRGAGRLTVGLPPPTFGRPPGPAARPARTAEQVYMLIEMTIKGLMVDPITNMPIIILRDKDGAARAADLGRRVRGERHRAADRERDARRGR